MSEYDTDADNVCPTCGEEFDTQRGVSLHHTQTHGESLDQRDEYTCGTCGEVVKRYPSEISESGRVFCSPECRNGGHSNWLTGENHPRYSRLTVACGTCGAEIEVEKRYYEAYDCHFCDSTCHGIYRSKHWTGKNNPRWEGGYSPSDYGEGFTEAKKERVRESQDRRCAGCGRHESCFEKRLSVHHIRSARELQDAPADVRNSEDNLVALCKECHGTWEGIPLRPQLE